MSLKLLDVKNRYEPYLLGITGVEGVDISEVALIIYVEKITPKLLEFLPKELEGIEVIIKETGKFPLLSLLSIAPSRLYYEDRVSRIRPVVAGISIGHPLTTAGTLGCFVKRDDELFGLSCNHIVSLQWGTLSVGKQHDPILQPAPYDGGVSVDKIGESSFWKKVELGEPNVIDAGCFSLTESFSNKILEVGTPSQVVQPYRGMKVKQSGRNGLTFGTVVGVNASVKVEAWGEALFKDLVMVEPAISVPGSSGAWVGDENDRSVGLAFAGSEKTTAVCRATGIEKILGVEFAYSLPYLSSLWLLPLGLVGVASLGGVKKRV